MTAVAACRAARRIPGPDCATSTRAIGEAGTSVRPASVSTARPHHDPDRQRLRRFAGTAQAPQCDDGAAIFVEPGRIVVGEKPAPDVGPLDALLRITTTTICGTDVHILKGEYPVAKGLTSATSRSASSKSSDRRCRATRTASVSSPARSPPRGHSIACLCGFHSQDGGDERHGFKAMGGWRFGNTIDGAQAEFLLVPDAMTNLAPVPSGLTDEQVLMCPDIMSTGFAGAEGGGVQIGDSVAVFAQGPIGLCATAGARLMGATRIIAVESVPERQQMALRLGADEIVDFSKGDPVAQIMRLTDGRGVDVAIEALGRQQTFEAALRVLRPGGTLSSLGVYATDLTVPLGAFAAGFGDHRIITTLCPGGKEAVARLMAVVASPRLDLGGLVTHRYPLERIAEAYELFAAQRDGVMKVAITP